MALPQLAPKDHAWIERLRTKYVPAVAAMIGPHFTLAFGQDSIDQSRYLSHVREVASAFVPIDFQCRRIIVGSHHEDTSGYVFLVPDEGNDALLKFHEKLHSGILAGQRRWDIPFLPHLTLGHFKSLDAAQVVCEQLSVKPIFVQGTISSVTVVALERHAAIQVATIPLSDHTDGAHL